MNAPLNPALLAPADLSELMLRVAEAVQIDAAIAVRGDPDSLRRGGHNALAAAHESAHAAVMRLDLNKLVAEFVLQAPDVSEQAAFEAAAKAAHFSTLRNATGFTHPITWRAHTIWLAGVRWARNQASEPP